MVKSTKLEPHRYCSKLGEKLITAKPITKSEVPDIVDKYLKIKEFKKTNCFRNLEIYIIVLIVTSAKHKNKKNELNFFRTHLLK